MIYTEMTKLAMKIAYDAHKDQVDKSGMPYIYHPLYLATQMDTEETVIVALLHDVIEDSELSFENLISLGFSDSVINALKHLTNDETIPYLEYIKKIKSNEIARKVKLTDLRHNSDISRLNGVDDGVKIRLEKYAEAIRILEEGFETSYYYELTRDKQIPLDNHGLFKLSIFRNDSGDVEKYSIDVEKIYDSHYVLSPNNMKRLEDYLIKESPCGSLIENLIAFIDSHTETDLADLFDALDIEYQQYHFDDYEKFTEF